MEEQLTSATAVIIFSQSLGPAIFLSICNVIFVESLKSPIVKQAPGADVAAIVQAGATKFRTVVSSDDLPAVPVAYANSLDRVFYFITAAVASATRIVRLASTISDAVAKLDETLQSRGLPTPSFNEDAPTSLPEEALAMQSVILDATSELHFRAPRSPSFPDGTTP
ncbi:hypothetical protein F5X98DRAFT_380733 [Xylaria grammica]|nr:hypothetical protein F5X98DRAFT_380733 [Xylaria grammica]